MSEGKFTARIKANGGAAGRAGRIAREVGLNEQGQHAATATAVGFAAALEGATLEIPEGARGR